MTAPPRCPGDGRRVAPRGRRTGRRAGSRPTRRRCSSAPAKGSARSRRGATPTRRGRVRGAAPAHPGHRRSPCAPRTDLLPAGQVRRRHRAAARGDPAEAGAAEGRRRCWRMSLSELGQLRRGAAGVDEGLRAGRRPGPAAHGRIAPAAHLHGARTGSGRRRRRAADVAAVPRRPRSALSLGPAVRELRLPADDEARRRRAGLRVAAPGGG